MNEPLISSGGAVGGRADAGSVDSGSWLGGVTDINNMFQRYRGPIPVAQGHYPLARAEDPAERKPVYREIVHAKVFNLQDETSLDEYTDVIQLCTDQEDGARLVTVQIKEPTEGVPNWSAFVQWVTAEILPPGAQGSNKSRPMNRRGARNGR